MASADLSLQVSPVAGSNPAAGTFSFSFSFIAGSTKTSEVLGFYKSIWKWMKCFLTLPGTSLVDTTYGTWFSNLFSSNITTAVDLRDFLHQCVSQATKTILSYQMLSNITDPAELLAAVNIQQLSINSDNSGFDLYLQVTNVAGTYLILQLPVDFKPALSLGTLPAGASIG